MTLEYAALLALVTVVIGLVSPAFDDIDLDEPIHDLICGVIGGNTCGPAVAAAPPSPPPRCIVGLSSREIGLAVTAFSIKVGRRETVEVTLFGDGGAEVATGDRYSAGVVVGAGAAVGGEGKLATLSTGAVVEGEAEGGVNGKAVYVFDTHEEALAWVEENRSVTGQIANAAGGPLADGTELLLNYLSGDREDPDAVVVELAGQLRGQGDAGVAGSLAAGTVEGSTTTRGAYRYNLYDGTSRFTSSTDSAGKAEVALLYVTDAAVGAGEAGYTVSYDAAGEPTLLTVQTVTETAASEGARVLVQPDRGFGQAGGEPRATQRVVETTTLDLRDPANRAAFDKAYEVYGPLAAPRRYDDPTRDLEPLRLRVAENAKVVRATYRVEGARVGAEFRAAAGAKFGAEAKGEETTTTLQDAVYRDNATSDQFGRLPTC